MEMQFKIGDLVRLSRLYGYIDEGEESLVGLIAVIRSTDGYYDVQWSDGSYDIDVGAIELEMIR
jgi:hypothetical protein